MALAAWWHGDEFPALDLLPGFNAAVSVADGELARINRIQVADVYVRRANGNRPYVAYIDGAPVAYGWVATREASIGELQLRFRVGGRDRYLWDFATLPNWQGHGIYPHLLQAILTAEAPGAERFWIIYAPENLPSGAGMARAGFRPVGQLSFTAAGTVGLAPYESSSRAADGAALLGVPLIETVLAPCWHCGGAQEIDARDSDLCWPPIRPTIPACRCTIRIDTQIGDKHPR